MDRAIFKPHRSWTRDENAYMNLAIRVGEIVCHGPMYDHGFNGDKKHLQVPYKMENGTCVLDTGNNWFLHDLGSGQFEVTHRYAGAFGEEFWNALSIVLNKLLD